ncbi:hypothetical protein Golob_001243 [Gossypium lobatum]|uniref:Uncharacterized protein n=1 Tax=Gossypium lobatum TaxID=34289 RepID=A0A7J8NAW8_9ROSI|nr:hypothetical protein [Gossypium lobatum]
MANTTPFCLLSSTTTDARLPEEPFFKVNFDAASQSHSKRFCSGIIVRDRRSQSSCMSPSSKIEATSRASRDGVKRNANGIAHILANEGLKRGDNTNLGEGMSEYLVDELENDRHVGYVIKGEPILGFQFEGLIFFHGDWGFMRIGDEKWKLDEGGLQSFSLQEDVLDLFLDGFRNGR